MPSLAATKASTPHGSRATRFVGQITDQLSDDIFVVWDLDGHRSFNAYNVTLSGLRVGDLLNCELNNDARYIEKVSVVDDDTREKYYPKQLRIR